MLQRKGCNETSVVFFKHIFIYVCCQQQPTSLNPGIITLGVIPDGSGTIRPNVRSFGIGDHIILQAQPYSGRVFFKWLGSAVTYNPVAEFDVTTKSVKYVAVFPVKILTDSLAFIINYPPHTLNAGEMAIFDIGLNMPLDSTYSIYCICKLFSEYAIGIHAHGNTTSAKAGCKNNSATIQNIWTISVRPNKTDSMIFIESITYAVEWK